MKLSILYPHFENPHVLHTTQPSTCSSTPPQSGQTPAISPLRRRFPAIALLISIGAVSFVKTGNSGALMFFPGVSRYRESAVAMASEQERIRLPLCQIGDGHRIPLSCATTSLSFTPLLRASEMSRLIASDWLDVHPPDRPI